MPDDKIQPAAIWSTRGIVFDRDLSLTQNVILSQGRFALSSMITTIDHLYELIQFMPDLMDVYIHPDIPKTLTEICIHQGIASSIMFNNSERLFNENAAAYKLRMERFEYVKSLCDRASISVSILTNRKIRNHLVHVDTHLEKALRRPKTGWIVDSAIASRDQFSPPLGLQMGYCRTFVACEEVILHLDNEISVRHLRNEAGQVLSCVFGNPTIEPLEPPADRRRNPPSQPPQTEA